jgi:magnesium transporter
MILLDHRSGWSSEADWKADVLSKSNKNQRQQKKRRNGGVYQPFKRGGEVGGIPGQVDAHSDSYPTIVNYIGFDRNNLEERSGLDLKGLQSLPDKPGQVVWLDVVGLADISIIEYLGKRYGIHPLLLEDLVHTHQRPKVEVYDGNVALIMRMVESTMPMVWEQVSFVLCGSTVLTFQERPGDSFEPVRKRIRKRLGSIGSLGADFTMYSLIDASIDGFFPLLEEYGRTLEELEEAIESGISSEVQRRVHSIRSEMSQLRKTSWAHREAVQRLVNEAEGLFAPSTLPFLRDCLDHTGQVLDVAETFRDVAGDMRDLYFTQLSQRTNDVMKLLTVISTIFMPLSFIAGVYGMNFNYDASSYNMPETQFRYGYPIVIAMMATTAIVMLGYFYRKGWIFSR